MKQRTKAQLQEDLDRLASVASDDLRKVEDLEIKLRQQQRDVERYERESREATEKIRAIRQVIRSTLQVKYKWDGHDNVPEEVSEEVRLLRHLYEISCGDIPF